MSESNNNIPMRITQLEEATAYEEGMYYAVAKAGAGTKKMNTKTLTKSISECYKPEQEMMTALLKNGYYNGSTISYDATMASAVYDVKLPVTASLTIKSGYKIVLYWYDFSQNKFTTNATKYTSTCSLSFLGNFSNYNQDGYARIKFIILNSAESAEDYTGHFSYEYVSCILSNELSGEKISDRSITADKLANGVIPSNDEPSDTVKSSYTKIYTYNFVKGLIYKFTLKNNSSSTNPIAFNGIADVSNPSNAIWQFELTEGQSYFWTPQRNFEALSWASNGQVTVEIYYPNDLNFDEQKVFFCGANRDLTTLKAGIEMAEQYMNSILYVDDGEYDIIEELGDDYLNAIQSNDTLKGLQLRNNIHIVFSPNSKVLCNYTGANSNVCKILSAFNTFDYGFTIENLNLECSNIRYAFHDERMGGIELCKSIYKNCNIKLDNTNNSVWNSASCIGGGLGSNHEVLIENCIFEAIKGNDTSNSIYYHQSNKTSNPNHCCKLTIKDNYIKRGIIYFDFVRTDATWNTTILVDNNNMFGEIYHPDFTNLHTEFYEWNNIVRN